MRKANDMVPHSWVLDSLEILRKNEKVKRLLTGSMKSWGVELTRGEENPGTIDIRQAINFLRLLFVINVIYCVSVTTYT